MYFKNLIFNQSLLFTTLTNNIFINYCKFLNCIINDNGICIINNDLYNFFIFSTFFYNIISTNDICAIYGNLNNSNLNKLCFFKCSSYHQGTWTTGINHITNKNNGTISYSSFLYIGIDSLTHVSMSFWGSSIWKDINNSNSKSKIRSTWCCGFRLGNSFDNSINNLIFCNNSGGYILLFSSIYNSLISSNILFLNNYNIIDGLISINNNINILITNLIIYNCTEKIYLKSTLSNFSIFNLYLDKINFYNLNFNYNNLLINLNYPINFFFNLNEIYLCKNYNNFSKKKKYFINFKFLLINFLLI